MRRAVLVGTVSLLVGAVCAGVAGMASAAAPSSCANRILFGSNRDGDFEIYSMAPNGSDVQQVTFNSASDVDPVCSPAGSQIAFTSDRDGNMEIYTMAADGSGQTNRTSNGAEDRKSTRLN